MHCFLSFSKIIYKNHFKVIRYIFHLDNRNFHFQFLQCVFLCYEKPVDLILTLACLPEWGIIIQYIVWNAFALQSYLSNFKTICFQERHFRRFLWNKDETIGKTWQEITKQDHKRKWYFVIKIVLTYCEKKLF